MSAIYLDNNATTRTDPRVVEAMLPYFTNDYGNPASSSHVFGWAAGEAVDKAREEVAALLGAEPREVFFTSGATEACNLAIKGVFEPLAGMQTHFITQQTEHAAVLQTAKQLEKAGVKVTYLPVDAYGQVSVDAVRDAITDDTIMVSIMTANNEIGTVNRTAEIGALCASKGVLFHTDATQSIGKIPIDVAAMDIHLLSCSAHKLHGPKGIGALYMRRGRPRVRLVAQTHGGGQERGYRSGTLNVTGIVGFGVSARLCREEMEAEIPELTRLRDRLIGELTANLPGATLVGHPTERLPNNVSLYIPGVHADGLMASLPDIAISSGSACSSAAVHASHVLTALNGPPEMSHCTIRLGVSRFTTDDEITAAVARITAEAQRLRQLTAVIAPEA